jgi:CO dehydrogenase maturation factor
VKVAFVGKGGSGKTTLTSLFVRHLAGQGLPVVAIDADINQHLGEALGVGGDIPAMGAHLAEIKEFLRGGNPRIASAAVMVKTTPPGQGSRLLRPGGADPVHGLAVPTPCGAMLMATGPFSDDDLGVSCYHAKTGAVELYLNHLVDGPGEYVVVDCTAGAESFASGMFTRFDLTVLVAEPTRKSVGVCRQWCQYADGYDVATAVVGNKVLSQQDVTFLRGQVGDGLLTWLGHEPAVRAMEQGSPFAPADLGGGTRAALQVLQDAVDARVKDWAKFTRQMVEFHLKNARSWANAATGTDLAAQVDPEFTLCPDAVLRRRAARREASRGAGRLTPGDVDAAPCHPGTSDERG